MVDLCFFSARCLLFSYVIIGNGEIAYCDVQGELGMLVVNKTPNVVSRDEIVEEDENSLHLELQKEVVHASSDDDDEDNENAISLEKLKRETLGPEESESELRSSKCVNYTSYQ